MVEKYWLVFWCLQCSDKFLGDVDESTRDFATCTTCGADCLPFEAEYEAEYLAARKATSQAEDARSCVGYLFWVFLLGPLGMIIGATLGIKGAIDGPGGTCWSRISCSTRHRTTGTR